LPLHVRYYTDPACPESWAGEPALRKLMVEFGDDLSITYVMGGLAREFDDPAGMMVPWLDAAERSGMPVDPRLWAEAPLSSSYPACMAVKAAAEQGPELEGRYLRALREGIFCFRRKLDTVEALVEAARAVGLDAARFRSSLESNAIVEAFGADLEETRALGVTLPHLDFPDRPASPPAPPALSPLDAVVRFGRTASIEVATVCGLAVPVVEAELWRLAVEWKVKPVRVLTGVLWEPA
jgi:predicted DsbA family dithiol-disulfide isomerase